MKKKKNDLSLVSYYVGLGIADLGRNHCVVPSETHVCMTYINDLSLKSLDSLLV